MKLEQLKMLKVVAEQGTLKKASEVMYKTQPAISQGIKQLETQLGLTLFNRSSYRLELTSEGKYIFQHALRVLNEVSEIEQISKHFLKGNEDQVIIAVEATFDICNIASVLKRCQSEFPDTQVILQQEYLSGSMELLMQGKVDMSISPLINEFTALAEFERQPIGKASMINVASNDVFERIPNLTKSAQLRNEFQIVVNDTGSITKDRFMGVQLGQKRWFTNNFDTKLRLILSGVGWGRIPEYVAAEYLNSGRIKPIELEDVDRRMYVEINAFKQKTRVLGPVASSLWAGFGALSGKTD